MNILNRKLHLLEKNVLPELPEKGTTIGNCAKANRKGV